MLLKDQQFQWIDGADLRSRAENFISAQWDVAVMWREVHFRFQLKKWPTPHDNRVMERTYFFHLFPLFLNFEQCFASSMTAERFFMMEMWEAFYA